MFNFIQKKKLLPVPKSHLCHFSLPCFGCLPKCSWKAKPQTLETPAYFVLCWDLLGERANSSLLICNCWYLTKLCVVNHSFSFDMSVVVVAEMSVSLKTCAIKSISSFGGRHAIAFKSRPRTGHTEKPWVSTSTREEKFGK